MGAEPSRTFFYRCQMLDFSTVYDRTLLHAQTKEKDGGRHANLGCHGEEGVSFTGCLFTRKLLQHHGNDPFPFALQQVD